MPAPPRTLQGPPGSRVVLATATDSSPHPSREPTGASHLLKILIKASDKNSIKIQTYPRTLWLSLLPIFTYILSQLRSLDDNFILYDAVVFFEFVLTEGLTFLVLACIFRPHHCL